MEKYKRKSIFEKMKVFSPQSDENDFIEVTEWYNGEGWDINIETKYDRKFFQLSWEELDAIKYIIATLSTYSKEEYYNGQNT